MYEAEPEMAPGLAELSNVVLLPHVGSATHETRAKMAEMVATDLLDGLQGRRPAHLVNPEGWGTKG